MKELGGETDYDEETFNINKIDCVLIFFSFLPNDNGESDCMMQFENAKRWCSRIET